MQAVHDQQRLSYVHKLWSMQVVHVQRRLSDIHKQKLCGISMINVAWTMMLATSECTLREVHLPWLMFCHWLMLVRRADAYTPRLIRARLV